MRLILTFTSSSLFVGIIFAIAMVFEPQFFYQDNRANIPSIVTFVAIVGIIAFAVIYWFIGWLERITDGRVE